MQAIFEALEYVDIKNIITGVIVAMPLVAVVAILFS